MSRVRPDSAEDALAYVLSRWFGAGSLLTETTTAVLADLEAEGYRLVPVDKPTEGGSA